MPNSYFYSNVSVETTLSGSISAGATSVTVASTSGYPASFPFIAALDYGAATEELVKVTAAAGTIWTVERAFGGTSAQSHSMGAKVRHVYNAQDATDFRTHEATGTAVHGLTGTVVGTSDTQTVSNKTFTAGILFNAAPRFEGATVANKALDAQVTGDSNPRFQLAADGKLVWGSGSASGDTELYREAADVLTTNDVFRTIRAAAGDNALSVRVSGDTASRLLVSGSGKLDWGAGGASAVDTNLYRSGADTLTTDDSFVVGTNLSVTGTSALTGNVTVTGEIVGGALFARKTADTARSSTTTTTADPHLSVTVAATATYVVHGYLIYDANSTGDINLDWTVPAGAAGSWQGVGYGRDITADGTGGHTIRMNANTVSQPRSYGGVSGSDFVVQTLGILRTTGTGGTFALEWAQAVSDAGATTLRAESFILLRRVA